MNRFERVAFIVISEEENSLLKPIVSFSSDTFPFEQNFEFRVGFVSLKPNSRYFFSVHITPLHIVMAKSESVSLPDAMMETAKMYLDTEDGNKDVGVVGQVSVSLGKIKIVAKGLYQMTCLLTQEEDGSEIKLHSLTTFFSVE